MQFQSWGPNVLIVSREGVSLPAPFSPITERLVTSIMLFSFTGGFWGEEDVRGRRWVRGREIGKDKKKPKCMAGKKPTGLKYWEMNWWLNYYVRLYLNHQVCYCNKAKWQWSQFRILLQVRENQSLCQNHRYWILKASQALSSTKQILVWKERKGPVGNEAFFNSVVKFHLYFRLPKALLRLLFFFSPNIT